MALVAVIVYSSAVFHRVDDFAGGLLLIFGLAAVLGVKETTPIAAVAMGISNVTPVWVFRRAIPWQETIAIFTAALPGIILGAIFFRCSSRVAPTGFFKASASRNSASRFVLN